MEMGGMAMEEVDDVHNSLVPDIKKMEPIERILVEGGTPTSLHQPGKINKLSSSIVEILASSKMSAKRRKMT